MTFLAIVRGRRLSAVRVQLKHSQVLWPLFLCILWLFRGGVSPQNGINSNIWSCFSFRLSFLQQVTPFGLLLVLCLVHSILQGSFCQFIGELRGSGRWQHFHLRRKTRAASREGGVVLFAGRQGGAQKSRPRVGC